MIVAFGEVMLRVTPAGMWRFRQALPGAVEGTFGGGEANVSGSLALLGRPAIRHARSMRSPTPWWAGCKASESIRSMCCARRGPIGNLFPRRRVINSPQCDLRPRPQRDRPGQARRVSFRSGAGRSHAGACDGHYPFAQRERLSGHAPACRTGQAEKGPRLVRSELPQRTLARAGN